MPRKMARLGWLTERWSPAMVVAVGTARRSCRRAGKSLIFSLQLGIHLGNNGWAWFDIGASPESIWWQTLVSGL
jgi:hypothetical protein